MNVWAHLCRAEKVRGPDGPLAEPERVAIKQLKGPVSQATLEQTEQEAHIMERLSGRFMMIPFHSLHLPPADSPHASAYLAMGSVSYSVHILLGFISPYNDDLCGSASRLSCQYEMAVQLVSCLKPCQCVK